MLLPMVFTQQPPAEYLNVDTPTGPVAIFSCAHDCARSPCRIHFDAKARGAKFPVHIGALACARHVVSMYVAHPNLAVATPEPRWSTVPLFVVGIRRTADSDVLGGTLSESISLLSQLSKM
jgi:hypothetical protein